MKKTIVCLAALLAAPFVHANLAENSGFGSRTAALGGAGASWGSGAYSAYSNPAELSADGFDREPLQFSWALVYLNPTFTPIKNVVVENDYVSDQTRSADVDTSYRNTFGQAIGLSYRMSDTSSLQPTVGAIAFLPIEQIAYADTGEVFIPEYVLHRSRTQRPQFGFSGSLKLASNWSLGVGVAIIYSITGNGTIFLNTTPGKPSVMRISASMKPRPLPYAGFFYASDSNETTLGIVARAPATSPNEYTVNSSARAFGDLAALDFNFKATSALYYDPLSIEVGVSQELTPSTRIVGQIEYQRWSAFEAPSLKIENPSTGNCDDEGGGSCTGGITISPSINPSFAFRDLWIPRLGVEHALTDRVTLRGGYFYRGGILDEAQLAGAGNTLDPPRHALSAGIGWKFDRFLHLDAPFILDLHAQFQKLMAQTITKSAGNEAGTDGSQKIGAPGYEAGGTIIGGGATLSWNF